MLGSLWNFYSFSFSSLFLFFFVSKLHIECGAWTHSPEIKNRVLFRLSKPGVPKLLFFWSCFFLLLINTESIHLWSSRIFMNVDNVSHYSHLSCSESSLRKSFVVSTLKSLFLKIRLSLDRVILEWDADIFAQWFGLPKKTPNQQTEQNKHPPPRPPKLLKFL